ncbi:hypothetical protein FB45DRAFT_897863 [Roridomyces roridus]|uniref:VWFA domain-containing protein n=1 Tax=Roridomyces roridus TaxID=1738132 RepID=A0AAD7FXE2_9AGAR|nr:hypothetical protein FB45DRAFT_897863 [Roridomyces roridus]
MVAVAFVVDASSALAAEWGAVLNYVMQMLRRLSDAQAPGSKMRVAFVTYGTQGSPLVCRNFFMELGSFVNAFRDESSLGIGQTIYGGGDMGMAALEGFVAALELFDTLGLSASPVPPQHIIHVAASLPDDSERPQCNLCPSLDFVTWDSLPAEIKRRNIHLSSISLRPNLDKFSTLHSLSTTSPMPPWFSVKPQHTVLLSGYPTKGLKRPGEPLAAEKTPDPKRAKISPPNTNTSPNLAQSSPVPAIATTPPKITPPSAPPSVNSTATAVPPPSAPPSALPMHRFTQQQVNQLQIAYRAAETPVRALEAAISEARARGDTAAVESFTAQWTEKNVIYTKLKQSIAAMLNQQRMIYRAQQMAAAQQGQSMAGQTQQGVQAAPGSQQASDGPHQQIIPPQPVPTPQSTNDHHLNTPDTNDNAMPPQPSSNLSESPGHMRSLSGGMPRNPNLMPANMPTNPAGGAPSPLIQQQMQKMLEQKERARQTGAAMRNAPPVWQGPITWSGTNPAGEPRQISTFVVASSVNPDACHATTWPTSLTLTIAEKPAVTMQSLQVWMRRVEPAICTFAANPTAPNSVNNEMGYKALVALLVSKNLYFVSSWQLPNGKVSNNVLFFPVQGAGLVGAFFPLNGIPDLPQGDPAPSIIQNPAPLPPNQPPPPQTGSVSAPQALVLINNYLMTHGVNITPQFAAQLAKMNQTERNTLMQKLIHAGQEQRRQRLAAAQGQVPPQQMGMMPQMGQQPQQQPMKGGFNPAQFAGNAAAGGMGANPGMYTDMMGGGGPGRGPTGGSGGAVSYEMMQSFMARNQEMNGNVGG